MTKIIYRVLINLVTPKARAKHEPFVQQTGLRQPAQRTRYPSPKVRLQVLKYFKFQLYHFLIIKIRERVWQTHYWATVNLTKLEFTISPSGSYILSINNTIELKISILRLKRHLIFANNLNLFSMVYIYIYVYYIYYICKDREY